MRIVVDAQALQAGDPHDANAIRDLFVALVGGWKQHDVFLILNAARPDRILQIRKAFAGFLPAARILLWYPGLALGEADSVADPRTQTAELVREGMIASLDADLVVVPFAASYSDPGLVFSAGLLHDTPTFLIAAGPAPAEGGSHGSAAVLDLARSPGVARVFLRGAEGDRIDVPEQMVTVPGDRGGGDRASGGSSIVSVASDAELVSAVQSAAADFGARPSPPSMVRPRLAYVSPLPPARSGISFYSAELLPALSKHYEIDLVVSQGRVEKGVWTSGHTIRDAEWFEANAVHYDRILYHFGNSKFHRHMFALLDRHPGVVVLHDFFLSGVTADMEADRYSPGLWVRELYRSHGYGAAADRFHGERSADVVWRYPCSGSVLANATGVIVHAENTRALARQWHGTEAERRLTVIPHLRAAREPADRAAARRALGLGQDDIVFCAFGGLGPTKLNHRLVEAWLASGLSRDARYTLLFVGTPEGGPYGRAFAETLRRAPGRPIRVTGWESEARFQLYLAAADVAVQLRALSRGETSGTVLDCMNGGVPLITNAHGSMADLPDGTTWMLADNFEDTSLVAALETLARNGNARQAIAARALDHVRRNNAPAAVAARYAEAIEAFASRPRSSLGRLAPALGRTLAAHNDAERLLLAANLALSVQPAFAARQILVDVSAIVRNDLRTGIERAARALIRAMVEDPPHGFRIEPVYTGDRTFFYARRFTGSMLGIDTTHLADEAIDLRAGDIYLMPDLEHESVIRNRPTYQAMRNHGVSVNFMVHDLLPVRFPQFFPPQAEDIHRRWLAVVAEADQVICVSRAVADDFRAWRQENGGIGNPDLTVSHSHHGADLAASNPTGGFPRGAGAVLAAIKAARSFLMVGTVEPRKGHAQVLDAFENLWAGGGNQTLVIVGKPGWMLDKLVGRLKHHAERDRRLIWIEQASDEYLDRLYGDADCLIAASLGEGFGLPLIEAAAHGLPIIARDIPVFREVAGPHAFYFDTASAQGLAEAIVQWIRLDRDRMAPSSRAMPRLTWAQSTANLLRLLLDRQV